MINRFVLNAKKSVFRCLLLLVCVIVGCISFDIVLEINSIFIDLIFSIFFYYIFIVFYNKSSFIVYILALIFTCFIWIENCLYIIWGGKYPNFELIITFIGTYFFLVPFISILFDLLINHKLPQKKVSISTKKLFFISFFINLLLWVPAFIAEYPGIIAPDTMAQFMQSFNDLQYNNANPFIHTLLINILFNIFSIFIKDINLIVFLISIVFAMFYISVFSYVSIYVYKKTNNIYMYILSILFYTLISYNVFYGIQISKDSFFACLTILFIIFIDKYLHKQSMLNTILLLTIGVLFSLGRSNGFYQVVATLVLIIPFCRKKNIRNLILMGLFIVAISYIILNQGYNVLFNYLNNGRTFNIQNEVNYNEKGEKLGVSVGMKTIPLQQLSFIIYKDRTLTEYQRFLLEKLAPLDMIKEAYYPEGYLPVGTVVGRYGDPSFYDIDKSEYTKIYLQLFKKYPFDFIESYFTMTGIYYSPEVKVIPYGFGIYKNDYGIHNETLISKGYTNIIERLYLSQVDTPIIRLLLRPGCITFLLLFAMAFFIKIKDYNKLVIFIPLLMNIAILLIATPTAEFRYYYPVAACLPLIVGLLLNKEESVS